MAKAKAKELDALLKTVYINPLTDFGFKKIFLNKDLLIAFLNDIIGTQIRDVQYQPTEGLGIVKEERVTIFDLLCTTKQEEQFHRVAQVQKTGDRLAWQHGNVVVVAETYIQAKETSAQYKGCNFQTLFKDCRSKTINTKRDGNI